ncbi:nucleolar protein of 40 kDa isoform X2 [Oncorhynchus nerka]|uniref:nucleolar protein of 40 kDa isoform X2 n=1 Tax=Oncorhynchus nerka TaxID=8023 RepID=UPI0031B7F1DE
MADFDHDQQEPAGLDGLPAMYSIVKGEVASVQTYGAFIKIPGYRKQGLVHISELSACRVENVAEVVDVGEQVWIKVIGREMRDDKVKLSFSMKAVNQGTGKDLDPNNVIAEQDERRRRQFKDGTGRRITLEAVLNTTCKKCGCKGHFAKDCFSLSLRALCSGLFLSGHFAQDCFSLSLRALCSGLFLSGHFAQDCFSLSLRALCSGLFLSGHFAKDCFSLSLRSLR